MNVDSECVSLEIRGETSVSDTLFQIIVRLVLTQEEPFREQALKLGSTPRKNLEVSNNVLNIVRNPHQIPVADHLNRETRISDPVSINLLGKLIAIKHGPTGIGDIGLQRRIKRANLEAVIQHMGLKFRLGEIVQHAKLGGGNISHQTLKR